MDWNKFEQYFDKSYHKKMKPFITSDACDGIYSILKSESLKGVQIAPSSSFTWRAFKETPLEDVKVILLGDSPYSSFYDGKPIADGLAFSCSVTGKIQPCLSVLYGGIEEDVANGLKLDYFKIPDLSVWAKDGVLLLNSALTTIRDINNSHSILWEPLMKHLFTKVFSNTNIPVIMMGKKATYCEKWMNDGSYKHLFKIEHPSDAVGQKRNLNTEGVFTKVNKILMDSNGYKIDWLPELPF